MCCILLVLLVKTSLVSWECFASKTPILNNQIQTTIKRIVYLLIKNKYTPQLTFNTTLNNTFIIMTNFYAQHNKAYVAVDCIIFGFDEGKLKLLIGKRQMNPGFGEWSLYGGFVEQDESIDEAASRVLLNLTGMKNAFMKQVGAFGAVDRDPGERVISIAYYSLINVKEYDDTLRQEHNLEWISLEEIPKLYSDHNKMVEKALRILHRNISTEPLGFKLLPDLFTLTQLQHVYEAVLGHEIDKRNFRKRIKQIDFIEKTELIDKKSSKRGAALYRFNKKSYAEDPTFKL